VHLLVTVRDVSYGHTLRAKALSRKDFHPGMRDQLGRICSRMPPFAWLSFWHLLWSESRLVLRRDRCSCVFASPTVRGSCVLFLCRVSFLCLWPSDFSWLLRCFVARRRWGSEDRYLICSVSHPRLSARGFELKKKKKKNVSLPHRASA